MTRNNDGERDPSSWYIGQRLFCIVLMVVGAIGLRPWENPNPLMLLFSVFWFGINIHCFIYPWKYDWLEGVDY